MAEPVTQEQFGEFVKRMEQGFAHLGQRFDDMGKRFDDMQRHVDQRIDGIERQVHQMRNWLIGLYGIVVFGFIGTIFLSIIKGAASSGGG